ncbi:hypothetical protein SODALDRAFT_335619 [Sodiomyces alkalinus F11]|uniref:Uncharacterized protein n=1 Tax=Sodiomyces alkalinus (strain CBS 110278 / VKM F-3762 / F11) TaxID=1314773 RepID=A0A3N2PPU1_SODAK|nr:hypothetical protein SODALDRAFT_335619 [Sodiomyces alkalinus F11]ROT36521.1 hypothetical protein SODALDRAFT_335619 [Sodiomyces alkalinus F11]
MAVPTAIVTGARMLNEVEEGSLDEVLTSLRTNLSVLSAFPAPSTKESPQRFKSHGDPDLDALLDRNLRATQSATLQLTGRYLPLVYNLVSKLIAAPRNKAIVIIDTENRFDPTCLTAQYSSRLDDLHHVHVYRTPRCGSDHLQALVASVEAQMLYSRHESRGREWWGTIVIGSLSASPSASATASGPAMTSTRGSTAHVTASWKGWLRVDREDVERFHPAASAREALADRERRQVAVDSAGWAASCQWGGFTFRPEEERRQ